MRPLPLPVTIPAAGVSFHQEVLAGLQVGQELRVEHEPGNRVDPDACRIMTLSGVPVGYVPGLLAPRLLSSAPSPYRAQVAELLGAPGRMGLRVRLLGPASPVERHVSAPPVPEAGTEVFSMSGRLLGVLVRTVDDGLLVRTSSGVLVAYPPGLVRSAT